MAALLLIKYQTITGDDRWKERSMARRPIEKGAVRCTDQNAKNNLASRLEAPRLLTTRRLARRGNVFAPNSHRSGRSRLLYPARRWAFLRRHRMSRTPCVTQNFEQLCFEEALNFFFLVIHVIGCCQSATSDHAR